MEEKHQTEALAPKRFIEAVGWDVSLQFTERRLLIGHGDLNHVAFKFKQARSDASIYVACPSFAKVRWISLLVDHGQVRIASLQAKVDGHMSIHGSGIVSIRSNADPKDRHLLIPGSFLLDAPRNTVGGRHLFSALMAEPREHPVSPRRSDYVISSSKPPSPWALMFFAIPRANGLKKVEIQAQFDIDDLDSIPPEGGFGAMDLVRHDVVWYAYRTKYMQDWPGDPHISYLDGFHVPAFAGRSDEGYRFVVITPTYEILQGMLRIGLDFRVLHAARQVPPGNAERDCA